MTVTACFGEVMLRLSAPGSELLLQSGRLEVHVGGAEANVATGLARLGHPAKMISILPDNALGDAALTTLRSHGVDCRDVHRGDGRMGLYFVTPGAGLRSPEVLYDRACSSFAQAPATAYDWASVLEGVDRLHLSGVTPALGPGPAAHAIAAARTARELGVSVSFDGNYRSSLWESWESDPRTVLTELVGLTDILFGNHQDISLLLGESFSGDGAARRRRACEAAFAHFPNLKLIASTARRIEDADRHHLSARIDTPDGEHQTDEVTVSRIVDRIGAGDAFAAGVLHGLNVDADLDAALHAGLALTCLKHTLPGDASLFGRADIAAFLGGSSDVRR